ncbi:hypothetical protein M569_00754 [Genlisea aurea]|uniref:Homing endonuclease LAGLIDADG domain-containing protein n=1 Tax=Genlisea aurea TaxID=192259 RepID=S8D981_9LAMI|nr:hypothetical protein M569_00754 [Genlisea aurea]
MGGAWGERTRIKPSSSQTAKEAAESSSSSKYGPLSVQLQAGKEDSTDFNRQMKMKSRSSSPNNDLHQLNDDREESPLSGTTNEDAGATTTSTAAGDDASNVRLPLSLPFSATVSADDVPARVPKDAERDEIVNFSDITTGSLELDNSLALNDLKRRESPTVEVKELEELPEQWRRAKLAWLCKELPAHRSATFIRVLNAQRKWIRQEDCTYIAVHCMRIRENEAAFRVYKWMMNHHWHRFDFALATKLADFMGKRRNHFKCREIFNDIINQGLIPCESTYHLLIVSYLSSSAPESLDEACKIYNQMIHLGGYAPPLTLHNSLFRALLSKKNGESCKHHLKQAEFVYHNIKTSGLKIHSDVYGGLIWLHSHQDVIDKDRILALRSEMKSKGIRETTEVLISVLRASAKAGDIVEAERTWEALLSAGNKPPNHAFLYMMEVYSKIGNPKKSLDIFNNIPELSIASYTKIIDILSEAQLTDLAESLMTQFMNSSFEPSICSFIDMMEMYSELKLHDKVESTFFRCLEKSTPNEAAYNIYLESLVKAKNFEKAEEIFSQMHSNEAIGINPKSCNTVLKGYLTSGYTSKAKKVYEYMLEKRYDVEVESFLMEKLQSSVHCPESEATKTAVNLTLSNKQREIIIGLLLSGLSVQQDEEDPKRFLLNFRFREDSKIHSVLKRHIYNTFHEWIAFQMLVDDSDRIPHHFSTVSHSCYRFYAEQFWPQGRPVIPKLIHRWLTPRSLAYWYMYGGCRIRTGDIVLRLKHQKEEVLGIAKILRARSFNCLVKRKGNAFWLGFIGTDAAEFWKLVEPFVIADLKGDLQAGSSSGISSTSNSDEGSFEFSTDDDDDDERHCHV